MTVAIHCISCNYVVVCIYFQTFSFTAFSDHYNVPTFYCKLDQYDFLNASLPSTEMQVPCVEFASLTTSLILLTDILLLFEIIVFMVASMFNFQLYPKEFEYHRAAKFSVCTGMFHRFFYAKAQKFRVTLCIGCDLDFLVILSHRTHPG